jgi:tRNA (guanine-N7-)-methyltransferase
MRIRQHVDPRGAYFARYRGPSIVRDAREIEVEIGCADAQFLFERAQLAPSHRFIGLEIREDFVALVNRRACASAAPVEAIACHAQLHLTEIFASSSVDRVYINFPDPWFKRRHHDRRMVDTVLARATLDVLVPGGEIFIQTDVWAIALDALAAFEPLESLTNRAGEWSFWRGGNPYGVRSWREQHAEETGLPIWRLWYRKASG